MGLSGLSSLVLGASAASCSLIVNTSADQCKATADCGTPDFPGLRTCSDGLCKETTTAPSCTADSDCSKFASAKCVDAVCTRELTCASDNDCSSQPGTTCQSGKCQVPGCMANADCAGMGDGFICRKHKCVQLTSAECTTVYATKPKPADAYNDDEAIIFGSILPTNGGADAPYGKLVEDSIKLALDDFGKVDGIPGLTAGSTRPIVLVGCNDGPNEDKTDDAARHLIDDLDVPAIIGYAFSGNTIQVANDVTIGKNVVLFSPSATSALITNLDDKDLVWRTSPSDNIQAQALSQYYPEVEAAAKLKYPMIAGKPIKVAIVNHSDAYGAGLGDTLEGLLMFNGMPATSQGGANGNYKRIDYGKSNSPDLSKETDIVNFAPDIIFLFGFNEGPDVIFKDVEAKWKTMVPADGHYPFWVFSDGGEVASLWATHPDPNDMTKMLPGDITTEDQRTRVIGSLPGVNSTSWPPYGTFISEFSGSSYAGDGTADTIGPAGAYDILYLLAYSTVMVGKNPLTGPNLVKYGLKMMQKTATNKAQIDRGNILTTFPLLTTGAPINITGKSGPLPFDTHGDVATADIQIWCVPKGDGSPDVGTDAIPSGRYFDSSAGKMAGAIGAACGLP